jgi:hypothetical protein
MIRRLCVLLLIASPAFAFAASKEIWNCSATLPSCKTWSSNFSSPRTSSLPRSAEMVRQSLDAANRANTAVAVIQSGFQQSGNQLKTDVVGPVVGLSTRMDQVTNSVSTLQAGRLRSHQLAQPDPGAIDRCRQRHQGAANAAPPSASRPDDGSRRRRADFRWRVIGAPGECDRSLQFRASRSPIRQVGLCLAGIRQYLKYFGNTNLAPYAQFYIGWIHYSQKNYDAAVPPISTRCSKSIPTPQQSQRRRTSTRARAWSRWVSARRHRRVQRCDQEISRHRHRHPSLHRSQRSWACTARRRRRAQAQGLSRVTDDRFMSPVGYASACQPAGRPGFFDPASGV